ncbi:MAG: hypothetical protein UR93_C0028G0005 [Berkelbacteria bacterium GW2011_GWA2_35_9]|uniref:Uncharacterized protein n=1 Tax=Berkelbacteria bacterium GW2011_GWA2_35_9 TaxID=1618333 RepID=A0A0G0D3J0_9BACT|nr:MAG: hypothetical protein UR93_C0028G0005 [Berkelbacteria bacterium GW2011_GWA2_35_9]
MKFGPESYRSKSENMLSKAIRIVATLAIPLSSPAQKATGETTTIKEEYRVPGLFEIIKNNRSKTIEAIKKEIFQGNKVDNKVFAPDSITQLLELATRSDAPKDPIEKQQWVNDWTNKICGEYTPAIQTKINMGFAGVIPIGITEENGGLVINNTEGTDTTTNEKIKFEDMDLIIVGFDGNPQSGHINEKKYWFVGIDIAPKESGGFVIKQNSLNNISLNLNDNK